MDQKLPYSMGPHLGGYDVRGVLRGGGSHVESGYLLGMASQLGPSSSLAPHQPPQSPMLQHSISQQPPRCTPILKHHPYLSLTRLPSSALARHNFLMNEAPRQGWADGRSWFMSCTTPLSFIGVQVRKLFGIRYTLIRHCLEIVNRVFLHSVNASLHS